jgi:hypothetical protein
MQKGENIVSIALAAVVLLTVIALQRKWNPADLKDAANTAEDFILTTAGIGGQAPDIAGYERLNTYRLGDYRASLYRATPAPLIFARGLVVIYDRSDRPVYKFETLEGSKDPWSSLYDFSGRHGNPVQGSRGRSSFARDISGNGVPDIVVGQYSGGDHCCTTVTILELAKEAVTPIGRISGMDGLPFDGLEIRKLTKGAASQCIAHRPATTSCGSHYDAADVLSVYAFTNGSFQDQTANFGEFFQDVLRQDLAKWRQEKNRNMELLQTVAVDFAVVGQKDAGKRFFALNLSPLMPNLEGRSVDPNVCIDALETLVDRMPAANP